MIITRMQRHSLHDLFILPHVMVMEMRRFTLLICLLQILYGFIACAPDSGSAPDNHSRKKRYVVFPEGSVLSAAFCLSPTAVTEAGGIFTSGMAWAISYDLPNETLHKKDEFHWVTTHRQKRNLFVRMEKLMNTSGMNGKTCVLRTICEARSRLIPRQGILEEILRLLFWYPRENENDPDWKLGEIYAKAHEAGELGEDCAASFPCPFSLLHLGLQLGKH